MKTPRLLYILTLATVARCVSWDGPTSTKDGLSKSSEVLFEPTPAPAQRLMRNVFRRMTNDVNVCGHISGINDLDHILTCDDDGYTCFISSSIGAHGCCPSSEAAAAECRMHTRCVNEAEVCEGACISDPLIKRCYNPVPYCGTWLWDDGYSSFECDPDVIFQASVSSPQNKEHIKPNFTRPPTFYTGTETTTSATDTEPASQTSSNAESTPKDQTPAIAGAAGGGVVVVVLVILGSMMYRKRRLEHQRESTFETEMEVKKSEAIRPESYMNPRELPNSPLGVMPDHKPREIQSLVAPSLGANAQMTRKGLRVEAPN